MQLVDRQISMQRLAEMAQKMDSKLVKAVVDIQHATMVVDAPFHADEESFLLEQGSRQENLLGNRSRGVDDPKIQEIVKKIVHRLVVP